MPPTTRSSSSAFVPRARPPLALVVENSLGAETLLQRRPKANWVHLRSLLHKNALDGVLALTTEDSALVWPTISFEPRAQLDLSVLFHLNPAREGLVFALICLDSGSLLLYLTRSHKTRLARHRKLDAVRVTPELLPQPPETPAQFRFDGGQRRYLLVRPLPLEHHTSRRYARASPPRLRTRDGRRDPGRISAARTWPQAPVLARRVGRKFSWQRRLEGPSAPRSDV